MKPDWRMIVIILQWQASECNVHFYSKVHPPRSGCHSLLHIYTHSFHFHFQPFKASLKISILFSWFQFLLQTLSYLSFLFFHHPHPPHPPQLTPCVYAHTYIYIYIYMFVCAHLRAHVFVCVCVCVCAWMCVSVPVCVLQMLLLWLYVVMVKRTASSIVMQCYGVSVWLID